MPIGCCTPTCTPKLHVIAATFNGFDSMVPDWIVAQENRALHAQALRRVFAM